MGKPIWGRFRSVWWIGWDFGGRQYQIQFRVLPREWMWGIDHIYYDGPHCFYGFGLVSVLREPRWCAKCYRA